MRKTAALSLLLFTLMLSPGLCRQAAAQQYSPTPVEISKEKVNVRGTILYVHKVLKGQTLYSVSKAYNVPIDVLIKQNPALKDGLKTGSLIYIPTSVQATPPAVEKKVENPAPQTSVSPAQTDKTANKKYKKHVVKWYETISDISAKYSISAEAIIDLNKLPENPTLQKKQILLIPDKDYVITKKNESKEIKEPVKIPEKTIFPPVQNAESPVEDSSSKELYIYDSERSYEISLVLPFGTRNGADNANVNQMDFYSGALMAFKDFQNETGQRHFHLNVVDISDYPSIPALINSKVLDRSEIIIGPVFEKNLREIANYAHSNRIPIVSPMDPKTEYMVSGNPFFFQFPTKSSLLKDAIIDKIEISTEKDSSKTHLYFEKGTKDSPLVVNSIKELSERGIIFDTLSYGILEGRGIDTIMFMQMDTLHLNNVMVASESEAFVSDILRNLHLLQSVDTINIEVYGEPRWRNFEIVELEYLHLLNTHLSLQYYIDYNSENVKKFVASYWQNFKAEPTPFSFQGYDILTYFLSALSEFGREFPSHIEGYQKKLLQSDIKMVRQGSDSGYENQATRNIVYQKGWLINPWR